VNVRQILRRHGNLVFAAAMTGALQLVVWTDARFAGERVVNALAALAFGGALFLRGRLPLVPMAVGAALIVGPSFNELANSGVLAIGVMACLYTCGAHAERLVSLGGLGIGLATIPLSVLTSDSGFSANDTFWVTLIVLAPWSAGRLVRGMRDRARLLESRNIRLETEQEAAAARATAEERIRIARELHDVIAHALSLIVVQARGGRRMVHRDRPDEVLETFDTVEHAAQRALEEMRRLLGMLREDEGDLALTPPPSLRRLPELINRFADAGLHANLVVEGEPRDLPPGTDVSAYRIIQEALTNALRHSGTSKAQVVVTYAADRLELQVLDEGQGPQDTTGAGHGLIGIRERVAIYGGELQTGTRPGGGYALKARLPLWAAE
jgi:signal transduction histidine kinase